MVDQPLHVLLVCTANVCRSPLAEAVLAEDAARAGFDLIVSSAGLDDERRPVHPTIVTLLAERGLRPRKPYSDPVTGECVDRADLVLTMTGAHAIEVAGRHRNATRRVFTFDHAVQVVPPVVDRSRADWEAQVTTTPRRYPQQPGAVDVPDPINGTEALFRAVAGQIDDLCAGLVTALSGAG